MPRIGAKPPRCIYTYLAPLKRRRKSLRFCCLRVKNDCTSSCCNARFITQIIILWKRRKKTTTTKSRTNTTARLHNARATAPALLAISITVRVQLHVITAQVLWLQWSLITVVIITLTSRPLIVRKTRDGGYVPYNGHIYQPYTVDYCYVEHRHITNFSFRGLRWNPTGTTATRNCVLL